MFPELPATTPRKFYVHANVFFPQIALYYVLLFLKKSIINILWSSFSINIQRSTYLYCIFLYKCKRIYLAVSNVLFNLWIVKVYKEI